jgi:hypothetical protein
LADETTATAPDTSATVDTPSISEPVCEVCGLPLRVLRGGLQVGSDGKSIVNVAVLGCVNSNFLGSNTPCGKFNAEQARNETPVNTFEE